MQSYDKISDNAIGKSDQGNSLNSPAAPPADHDAWDELAQRLETAIGLTDQSGFAELSAELDGRGLMVSISFDVRHVAAELPTEAAPAIVAAELRRVARLLTEAAERAEGVTVAAGA